MKISKRLKEIYECIPKVDRIIDVGCDHGLLGIYALLSKKCKYVINTDISPKAIIKAKENTQKYNVNDLVTFFVTDGLKEIPYKKEDVIILTGMGAHTIVNIIQNEKKLIEKILTSPQKDIPYLRKKMVEMGYKIVNEKAIFEKKWYVIIYFEKGREKYKEEDYILGPFLKQNKEYTKALIKKEKWISIKKGQKTKTLLLLEKQKNLS